MRLQSRCGTILVLVICLASFNSIVGVNSYHMNDQHESEHSISEDVIGKSDRVSQSIASSLSSISDSASKSDIATGPSDYLSPQSVSNHESSSANTQSSSASITTTKRSNTFGLPALISKNEGKIEGDPAPIEVHDQAAGSSSISPPVNTPLEQIIPKSPVLEINNSTPQPISTVTESSTSGATSSDQQKQVKSENNAGPAAQSQARGFASGLLSGITGQDNSESSQSKLDSTSGANPLPAVPKENLPTIIEKNVPVDPSTQVALGSEATGKVQFQNSSMSSARTFDSWTNCVGSASNKYGTCKNDIECEKHKGRADGSCMGGLGVCCVMALSCNDKSIENNTFFANPDFPEPSWEARQCQVELTKKGSHVVQIMIEFDEFQLAPPNADGECITDVFQVGLASNKPSPYSQLRICGQNTGQHMYLDVSQIDEPLVLKIATSGGGFPRRWSIRIVQMDYKNHLLAPPGCLQYYTDTVGHFRSFHIGKNLKNLYYAICFRIDNGYSGIRFTANYFGMNGPACRRRIGKQPGRPGLPYIPGGNGAHPHHLVIPPSGSQIPPPAPTYGPQPLQQQYQQQPPPPPPQQQQQSYQQPPTQQPNYGIKTNYKRSAPGPQQQINQQQQQQQQQQQGQVTGARTFSHLSPFGLFGSSEKEAKLESKEFEKFDKYDKQQTPYYQPTPYIGSTPYPPMYGQATPYPPQLLYGGQPGKDGLGGEKTFVLNSEQQPFGWKDKEEMKYGEKYGNQPGYMIQPGPYGPLYGPPQMGYHHKEIGKFGEKYDHLYEKHEKNHLGKDEKSSSWWSSFNFLSAKDKTDKKEKEKFFMHHEAIFPLVRIPEMPHCEPRYCGANDVITFPPSGDSIAEMCGNQFNRGRGPKIISGSPLVVYVSNRGMQRGAGFDMKYEQVFYIPKAY